MTLRRETRSDEERHEGGFTGFVRSLLSNVPWSERLEVEQLLRFDRPSAGQIHIVNTNGRTSVWGKDRDDIEVRAIKIARAESEQGAAELLEGIRVASNVFGGTLELDAEIPQKWNRRGTVHLEILLPKDLSVDLSSSTGRIDIEGMHGCVSARSTTGSAIIRDVIGDIRVATSNAKVSCSHTCGRLVARSRNGKIELDDHAGSVDACTSNGLIRASLDELGSDGVQLSTSNGRIVLALPENVDCDIDVRVDNGTIRNDRTLCRCTRDSNGVVLGQLGAGGALVKLRTSNGSISLR